MFEHLIATAMTEIFPAGWVRRLSENALFPHIFVKLEKIILGILVICLR
jgi:hypothetical protein